MDLALVLDLGLRGMSFQLSAEFKDLDDVDRKYLEIILYIYCCEIPAMSNLNFIKPSIRIFRINNERRQRLALLQK